MSWEPPACHVFSFFCYTAGVFMTMLTIKTKTSLLVKCRRQVEKKKRPFNPVVLVVECLKYIFLFPHLTARLVSFCSSGLAATGLDLCINLNVRVRF